MHRLLVGSTPPRASCATGSGSSIADGNETVPTVIVGPVGMVNPSIGLITRAVADQAPHLLKAT